MKLYIRDRNRENLKIGKPLISQNSIMKILRKPLFRKCDEMRFPKLFIFGRTLQIWDFYETRFFQKCGKADFSRNRKLVIFQFLWHRTSPWISNFSADCNSDVCSERKKSYKAESLLPYSSPSLFPATPPADRYFVFLYWYNDNTKIFICKAPYWPTESAK